MEDRFHELGTIRSVQLCGFMVYYWKIVKMTTFIILSIISLPTVFLVPSLDTPT